MLDSTQRFVPGEWYAWTGPCPQAIHAVRKDFGGKEDGWAWGFVAPAEFYDLKDPGAQSVSRLLKTLKELEIKNGYRAWVSDFHVADWVAPQYPYEKGRKSRWLLHRERAFRTKEEAVLDLEKVIAFVNALSLDELHKFAVSAGSEWHVPSAGEKRGK